MPNPIDIYGALAAHIESNISDLNGSVWVTEEPETEQLNYAVVDDKGFQTQFGFESVYVSTGNISVHVFAPNALTARTIGKAIKTLFGPQNSAESIANDGSFEIIAVTETGFQLAIEADPDREGARVFRYTVDLKVEIQGGYETS